MGRKNKGKGKKGGDSQGEQQQETSLPQGTSAQQQRTGAQQQGTGSGQQGRGPQQQGGGPQQQGGGPQQQGKGKKGGDSQGEQQQETSLPQGTSAQQQRTGAQQQGTGSGQQGRGPQQQGGGPQQQGSGPQQQGKRKKGGDSQGKQQQETSQGTSAQQQRTGAQQQGTGSGQQGGGPQQQGSGPQQQGGGAWRQTGGPQQKGGAPQQQGGAPQQQVGAPQQQVGAPQQQAGGVWGQTGGPQQQGNGPQQQRGGPQQQRGGPQQQRLSTQQQGGGPQQQRGYPQQQGDAPQLGGGPHQQGGGPQQQRRGSQQRGSHSQQQGSGEQQHGGDSYQQGGASYQQGGASYQQGGASYQQGVSQGAVKRQPQKGGSQQQGGRGGRGRPQPQQQEQISPGSVPSTPWQSAPQGRGKPQQFQHSSPDSPELTPPREVQSPKEQILLGDGQGAESSKPIRPSSNEKQIVKERQQIIQQFSQMMVTKGKDIIPGTKGKKIQIESNHVSLNLGKLITAYHYDVNIVPDTPKKFFRTILEIFRQRHFPNYWPAFDGRKNAYTAKPLPFGNPQIKSDEVIMTNDNGKEKTYKIEMKLVAEIDLSPLHDVKSTLLSPTLALQCVDIVLRSAPSRNCVIYGRSFFVKPTNTIIDLGEGLEMYYGFYQSAIRAWKPLLNIDVAHKGFPKAINVLDVICDLCSDFRYKLERKDLNRPLEQGQMNTLHNYIKKLKIEYMLPKQPSSKRVFAVNGVEGPASSSKFNLDTGGQTTVENYFRDQKRYTLQYPHMPTLWVGSQNRQSKILLPVELCTLLEGQVVTRKMTETQTRNLIREAATSTSKRKEKIMSSLSGANHNNDPVMKSFGFSIGDKFQQLTARVLDPPKLKYANIDVRPQRGCWRPERAKFVQGAVIDKWTVVLCDTRANNNDALRFADDIYKMASNNGIQMNSRVQMPIHKIQRQGEPEIKKFFEERVNDKFSIIFVIVPNDGPCYGYVKKASEISTSCLTQCIKSRTLSRMNPQTIANILLKVNSKLNGINHTLFDRPKILEKPCMIMGADVTHPSPDSRDIPSVAAVTASHDPKAFMYNICWRLQQPTVEIISDLKNIMKEQLLFFYRKTRVKPERIVFFRDGVSEGQFDQVVNSELRALRDACSELEKDGMYQPSMTFLVVQKRHHTRFFPQNSRDSEDKNCNVPAGTCVDNTITNPCMQDFYLVSHASIQGVAKPTKYCTLWDDNNMSNDEIEELTYHLCHLFTRCNRSVSYPAPTYYAHLAAARAKVYVERANLDMRNLGEEEARFRIQESIRKDNPMFFV